MGTTAYVYGSRSRRYPQGHDTDRGGSNKVLKRWGMIYCNERVAKGEMTRGTADRVWYCIADFAESFGNRPMTQLSPRAIDRWLASHPEWKPGTRATQFTRMRAFCRWLVARGALDKDPFTGMKAPKRPRRNPRPLSYEDFRTLHSSLPDARAKLIVAFMYWLGLRCVEVSRLHVEDIDRIHNVMRVVGKGGHERTLPVVPQVQLALNLYLREHPASSGPLVRSYTSYESLKPETISIMVRRWMTDSGVKVHAFDGKAAHAMRHAAASELAHATRNPFAVQRLLGHADIGTSMAYVRDVSADELRSALELRDEMVCSACPMT